MRTKQTILSILLVFAFSTGVFAQSDLQFFGFYQARLSQEDGGYSIKGTLPPALGGTEMTFTDVQGEQLSPYVQQLNLMVRKEFSSNVSTFLNFEIINNFSTERGWGAFNLEELWLNYEYATSHSIKGGLLIPKFNNLNEIKNRMPLIPYILRPLIYEPSYRSLIDPSDFIPERAFVQLQGKIYSSDFEFNYAAYVGSSESAYIVSGNSGGSAISGADTTSFKLFGGRVGINYNSLRLGFSSSIDKDNQQALLKEDVQRVRLGVDAGFSLFNFNLDAEFIKVKLDPKNTSKNMDKLFYYGTLGYDFTDQIFAYGTYSYMENNENDFFTNGIVNTLFGGGYRASDNVVLKLQYSSTTLDGPVPIVINPALPPVIAKADLDFKTYSFAISVLF